MSTESPTMPDVMRQQIGQGAAARVEILESKLFELQNRGDIKPATLLNLSPFELVINSGLIPYKIAACPPDKRFHAHTVTTARSYPVYKGNEQMSDHSIRKKWDVNILLPVQQLMEFKHSYVGESEEDNGVKQGGVVVFEGSAEDVNPKTEVRIPYFIFRKNNRYIAYETRNLGESVQEAEAMMKIKCMAVLEQASRWHDSKEKQGANIQFAEHTWHDFALRKQWITQALPWRNSTVRSEDRCPRCGDQYVSKTGVCKCSFVFDPLTAYMQGEILIDHVRMNTLSKAQWDKVRAEQKRREEARA